jgi:hypothetical protein
LHNHFDSLYGEEYSNQQRCCDLKCSELFQDFLFLHALHNELGPPRNFEVKVGKKNKANGLEGAEGLENSGKDIVFSIHVQIQLVEISHLADEEDTAKCKKSLYP